MQIVKFLFPRGLPENPHRVMGRLLKPLLTILAGILPEYLHIDLRLVERGMLYLLASGELAHIVQRVFQPVRVD